MIKVKCGLKISMPLFSLVHKLWLFAMHVLGQNYCDIRNVLIAKTMNVDERNMFMVMTKAAITFIVYTKDINGNE